ncbi:putative betaine aldehyde dehydrogenase [Lasiosphaeria ovina]|uniref:aldehyde dehydrogenase (NAD(+)) n=1 Tax=Lasiosphaeria ovina TaxID=92902 RepID=A0AAE0JZG9_9PEZI|nr:putative betaine aldehyde dehydrogenase [Lasiosphaeria ovina]
MATADFRFQNFQTFRNHGPAAFPAWRDRSQDGRAELLLKFADALQANQAEFAALLGAETGKPPQAVGIDLYLLDETILDTDERSITLRHAPLGVGVGIIPWNFPILLAAIKLSSALLTGNTFIWKPSPHSPNTALKVRELAARVFPPGVVNVLSGTEDLGPWLTAHPGIAKVSFTGSVATGKKVMQACGATLKRVTLELGGNDAAIVCEDVDIADVVPKIATMAFILTGQVCFAIKRVYVHEKIYDAFLAALAAFVQTLKTGGAGDAEAVLGPIQNSMQYGKLRELYAQVQRDGWKTATPPLNILSADINGSGVFLEPAVVDIPPENSRLVQEEQFGPILPVLKWTDEDDAGTVWTNTHFEVGPPVGFGGHKHSGLGVESGLDGLNGWCSPQAVWIKK